MQQQINTAVASKLLSLFCDNNSLRPQYQEPFCYDGFICATDSRTLFAIKQNLIADFGAASSTLPLDPTIIISSALDTSPFTKETIVFADDYLKLVNDHLSYPTSSPAAQILLQLGNACYRAFYFHNVFLAARLLGSSDVAFIIPDVPTTPLLFRLYNGTDISVVGCIMPICVDDEDGFTILNLPAYTDQLSDIAAQINITTGEAAYHAYIEQEQRDQKAYAESKKVYLVQVVKSAWIPVEAEDPQSAMELAKTHTGGIDDDMFDDSDIEVEACNSYPEDEDDVESLADSHPTDRQGILTVHGWISWSHYYGEDENNDEFH